MRLRLQQAFLCISLSTHAIYMRLSTWLWKSLFEWILKFVRLCMQYFFLHRPHYTMLEKAKKLHHVSWVRKRVSEFQKRRNDSHQNMRIQVMSDDDEEVRRTVGTHQHSQPFFLFLFRLHTEPFYIKDFLFSSLALRVFSDVMIKSRNEQDES